MSGQVVNGVLRFVKEEPRIQTAGERLIERLRYNRRERLPLSSAWSSRQRMYVPSEQIRWMSHQMPPPRCGRY